MRCGFVTFILVLSFSLTAAAVQHSDTYIPVAAAVQDTDTYIKDRIEQSIRSHEVLARRPIKVTLRDRVVTLSGVVATDAEARDLMVSAREIPGVRLVRLGVEVVPGAGTPWQAVSEQAQKTVREGKEKIQQAKEAAVDALKSTIEDMYDSKITASIRWKLFETQKSASSGIEVHTQKAVVTLTGRVRTPRDAQEAVELAASVPHVVQVNSKLAIINPDTGS